MKGEGPGYLAVAEPFTRSAIELPAREWTGRDSNPDT